MIPPLNDAVVLAADAAAISVWENRLASLQNLWRLARHHDRRRETSSLRKNALVKAPAQIAGLPPLVGWLLVGGGSQATLVESLRNVARTYQQRVESLDDWLRFYLPLYLIVVIGGTAVVFNALSLLGPWYQMLTHFGDTLK